MSKPKIQPIGILDSEAEPEADNDSPDANGALTARDTLPEEVGLFIIKITQAESRLWSLLVGLLHDGPKPR